VLVRIMASWDGGDIGPDPDGFVHLSWPEQVAGTIQRHYADASTLTFLVLDEGALPLGALRIEESGHGGFPHLYATLPAAAVVRAVPWRAGEPIVL
jgi:glutathione S-transferase